MSFEQGSSYTVDEGSLVTVKVTLNADPERTVTIPITTTDQDGASSADYSGVPANVTFVPGDTEVDINFSASSDTVDDDGESVKLTFGNTLPAGVSAGNTDEAVVTITDDDVPSVEVSFEQSSYTVDEGSLVTVKVTLNADPERTVTIPITTTDQDVAATPAPDVTPEERHRRRRPATLLPAGVSAGNTDERSRTTTAVRDRELRARDVHRAWSRSRSR